MNISELAAETRAISDSDSTSYQDTPLLRRLNAAYEDVAGKLISIDTNILWGDSQYTSLPTGLINLVAETQSYSISTTISGWLTLQTVKVKDVDGLWSELERIDLKDHEPIEEYQKTSGMPTEYGIREDFIYLFPKPAAASVTTTNGLQLIYQRTADVFTNAELAAGTASPGFASPFHILLAYKAALGYCVSYKQDRVPMILSEINRLEKGLVDFYAKRIKDTTKRPIITTKQISHR